MNNPNSPNLPLNPNKPPFPVRPYRGKRGLQHVPAVVLEDPAPVPSDRPDEVLELVHEMLFLLDLCRSDPVAIVQLHGLTDVYQTATVFCNFRQYDRV